MLLPKREPAKEAMVAPVVQSQPVPIQEPLPAAVSAVVTPRNPVALRKPRLVKSRTEPFIALDDEPIESGIVMRVELPGSTPADIVFSPDGRARAVRLVNGTQRNY
jgi:hypothetical protein